MEIKLTLDVNDVNYILQTLGNLPSHTGAWDLIKEIKQQADPQVPEQPQEESIQ